MMSNGAALTAGVSSLSLRSPSSSRRATRVVNLRDIHRLIEECHESLQNNPTCLHTRAIRGHACMKAKMWPLAIQDFSVILQQRPEDIHCRFSRGMALFKSKRIEEAQTDFSTVLSINPHHVMARYARAGCFNTEGEFHRAIQDYTIALQDDEQKTEGGCFRTSSERLGRDLHQTESRASECNTIDLSARITEQPVRLSLSPAPIACLAMPQKRVPPPIVIPLETPSVIPKAVWMTSKPARRVVQVTVNLTDFSSPVSVLQSEGPRTAIVSLPATRDLETAQNQQQTVRLSSASRVVRKVTVAL